MAARTRSRTTRKQARPARVTKGSLEKSKRRIPGRLSQIRGERSQRSFARELVRFTRFHSLEPRFEARLMQVIDENR